VVRAFKTLDCAKKVRIHYLLDAPLSPDFLQLFPDAECSIQRFSSFVVGARDHFTVVKQNRLHVAGVMGEARLVATFGKSAWQWSPAEIDEFEARLVAAGFGELVRHASRSEVIG
jgi:hypothetical protein